MPETGSEGAALVQEPRAQRTLTRTLSFVIFLSVLNGTMFNVSIPDIAAEFGLMPSAVSWVITGYVVLFALGSLAHGKLADLHPVKNLITIGLVLLNAGSLLGLFSPWYPALVSARVLQAAGGSAIPALAMLIATGYFPPHMKGRTLGVIASTVALAAGIGPILGGYVTGALGWRYLFLLPLATALTIPLFRRYLPAGRKKGGAARRFDAPGAALFGCGVASSLYAVTNPGWPPALVGAALLGTFGGRLADRAGSARVVYLGLALLTGGYLLLSTLAGHGALAVCLGLIVPYAGFAFLQSSLPHTVSVTLSSEDMGTGMGLYNLFFFVSGAFSAAGLGKLMDQRVLGFNLNPLLASAEALNYRNLFVLLALASASAASVFHLAFSGRQGHVDSREGP